jgi:hypothetical protein
MGLGVALIQPFGVALSGHHRWWWLLIAGAAPEWPINKKAYLSLSSPFLPDPAIDPSFVQCGGKQLRAGAHLIFIFTGLGL